MNEVELIRSQLSLERQHAAAVSHALSASPVQSGDGVFREASVDYLAWALSRFEEREQIFLDLIRERFPTDDSTRRAAEEVFALRGTSREALAKLEAALRSGSDASPESGARLWADFLQFFDGPWRTRRDALDKLFAQHARITDWRTMSAIDADSIFAERHRYSRVRAALPAGAELPSTTSCV